MKKKLLLILSFIFLLSVISVSAGEYGNSYKKRGKKLGRRKEWKTKKRAKREEFKKQRKAERAKRKAMRKEVRGLIKEYRQAKDESQKNEIKVKLKSKITEFVNAKIQRSEQRIQKLKDRLKKFEDKLSELKSKKDTVIDERIQKMLSKKNKKGRGRRGNRRRNFEE